MALISLRQLLDHAAEHGYGVPAFNTLCPDVTCPWIDDLVDDVEI